MESNPRPEFNCDDGAGVEGPGTLRLDALPRHQFTREVCWTRCIRAAWPAERATPCRRALVFGGIDGHDLQRQDRNAVFEWDNYRPDAPEDILWDVVIVGAGMGGSFLGWSLAQQGLNVLFLEREPAL